MWGQNIYQMGIALFKELFIKNFKGFKRLHIRYTPGINIIYGKRCSGKTSLVDALLFLQLYSYYYGSFVKSRYITDPSIYSHMGETEFYIMAKLQFGEDSYYFRVDVDVEKPVYRETYIIGDTVFTYRSDGRLSIKDVRKSRYVPKNYQTPGESIWEQIGKWRIILSNLPWRSLGHLVSIEASYWGGITEAIKHVPEIISRVLVYRIELKDKKLLNEVKMRLKKLFESVFITHRYLREIAVLKYIDLKNAIGPSKHVSRIFDPYASNFPWIYLLLIRRGYSDIIHEYLKKLGLKLKVSVGSTIDNRYYLVSTAKSKAIYLLNMPTSLVKILVLVSALLYSNGVVIIDDFDEYLDNTVAEKLLEIYSERAKQAILTTRSEGLKGNNIISLEEYGS